MSHLPECPMGSCTEEHYGVSCPTCSGCLCPELRACEQRVREDYRANRLDLAHYEDGLQAARDAVAAAKSITMIVGVVGYEGETQRWMRQTDALAAIDALKGDSNV